MHGEPSGQTTATLRWSASGKPLTYLDALDRVSRIHVARRDADRCIATALRAHGRTSVAEGRLDSQCATCSGAARSRIRRPGPNGGMRRPTASTRATAGPP